MSKSGSSPPPGIRGDEAEEQNRVLTEIQGLAVRLASLSAEADLAAVLAEELRRASGAGAVTFGDFREEDRSIVLRSVSTDTGLLEKFIRMTGLHPTDIVSPVDEAGLAEMLAGGVAYRDSLTEVTFGTVPELVSSAVGLIFGISKYLGISYVYEGRLYGTSVLIFTKDTPLPREDFLLAFSALAAVSLRRRVAEYEVRRLNEVLESRVEERTRQLRAANWELENTNASLEQALQELKAAQARLVLTEKMATLGQLIAGIAHELNTPMGAILSSSRKALEGVDGILPASFRFFFSLSDEERRLFEELCASASRRRTEIMETPTREGREGRRRVAALLAAAGIEGSDSLAEALAELGALDRFEELRPLFASPAARELVYRARSLAAIGRSVAVIEASAVKAAKVVAALRVFARNDSVQPSSLVDVVASIENVLALYFERTKAGVEVRRSYARGSAVMGRPEELERVWVNLINNALQAMEFRGSLEIRTERRGRELVVSVVDDGPGIPDKVKERIFEPFFTTKDAGEGTGLGLDIARKIVENHGGSITFDSRPGRTVFSVRLPAAGADQR